MVFVVHGHLCISLLGSPDPEAWEQCQPPFRKTLWYLLFMAVFEFLIPFCSVLWLNLQIYVNIKKRRKSIKQTGGQADMAEKKVSNEGKKGNKKQKC